MATRDPADERRPGTPVNAPGGLGQLWTWLGVAVVSSLASLGSPGSRVLPVRLLGHAYDIGQHVAVGLISAVVAAVGSRLVTGRLWLRPLALFLLAFAAGWPLLSEDVAVAAGKISHLGPAVARQGAIIACVAAALAASFELGRRLTSTWARALALLVASAAAAANGFVLRHDYPGIHFAIAWYSALLMAGVLRDLGDTSSRNNLRRWILLPLVVLAIWSTVTVPPNAVLLGLSRWSGSVVAPLLNRLRGSVVVSRWIETSDPWFSSRAGRAAVPPSQDRLLPRDGVVVLLTVDCLRADVVEKDELAEQLPALFRLRRESVLFTQARSTAPATTQAITSLTTSTLYSQLYWTPLDEHRPEYVYPHQDPAPRFTELLGRAGVHTASIQGLPGISQKYGLLRGLAEEVILPHSRRGFAGVAEQVPPLLEVLRTRAAAGPLFVFAHFGDPHAPYDRGGSGTAFQRYLGEVRLVDDGIGKILSAIDELGIGPRTAVIVSADHGEAFGEHGTTVHATTLYEELLRVPLLVRLPARAPRKVEEPVSLLDLGPTVLDLFGLESPGSFMGQSLVPLMAGRAGRLDRPVAFESGRARRGMVFPDGIKVIQQLRGGIIEVYDTRIDPAESRNLYDSGKLSTTRVALVERFFAAHRLVRPGYELPFAR